MEVLYMVYQSNFNDCGKACVRNILCLLYKNDGYATSPLTSECDSFLLMREELEKFEAKYTSYETDDILKIKKEMLPAIAQLQIGSKLHFVVIKKINKNKVVFIDPQFGIIISEIKDFKLEFTGKILLKDSFKKNPGYIKMKLLKRNEEISYMLCFVFEAILLSLAILSTGFEQPFIISLISFLSFFMMIVLHNALNIRVQNRLEKEILLPYVENNEDKNDFKKLYKVLSIEIERKSKAVSYGTLLLLFLIILVLNSYYLAFLSVIALFSSFLRLHLSRSKNDVNRYCSFKEVQYLDSIYIKNTNRDFFYQSKNKSIRYILTYLFSWVFEAAILLVFLIFALNLTNRFNINLILYYLSISLSFSVFVEKLYETIMKKEEETKIINSLSRPLPFFLLKCQLEIDYNNSEGEKIFNAKKLHSRISKPSIKEQKMEKDI